MAKSTFDPGPTPDELRREVVRILAAGILRLQQRHALQKSTATRLDIAPETVLSGVVRERPSRPKRLSGYVPRRT